MSLEKETIIEIQHLYKKFKKIFAVKDLSLIVQKGDVYGFLGPNGAGKSTTIRILLDLVRPTKGDLKIFGLPLSSNRSKILSQIGALVEKPDFYSYLSGRRNLQLFGSMLGTVKESQIDEVLEIVHLSERADDRVKSYSNGMKQRLGIAQVLLGKPKLIILDEPSTGLDPSGMKDIRELILNLSQRDMTVFLSSHLLHEIELICNQMAVINKGELIVQGSVRELLKEGPMVILLEVDRCSEAAAKLAKLSYVNKVVKEQQLLKVDISYDKIPHLNRFLIDQGISVFRLQPQTSLEDYYLSLVQN